MTPPGRPRLLVHAQDIVLELRGSLKPELFAGGEELGAIYDHLHQQLVTRTSTATRSPPSTA